jgi:hypothetical protein
MDVGVVAATVIDVQVEAQPVAVQVAVADAGPEEGVSAAEQEQEQEEKVEEVDDGPSYPTDWSGLCNALCKEFPNASRTDVIGSMGRNDNIGKLAAAELRALPTDSGPDLSDAEYVASHGLTSTVAKS